MDDHSPLPWFVHETKHPHHLGGVHTERRIFTVSIHPQLKDHDGVVNGSVGIGAIEGGPPVHMVSISAVDAAFIVKAVNNHEALVNAILLLEKAEAFHLTCDECNGEDIPELCEKCFPLYDDARVARRQALADVGQARAWDQGEHEGCGIDSQRAFDKFTKGDKP